MKAGRWAVVVLAAIAVMASARDASAVPFTFNTSTLAGGTYTLAFDLTDGDGSANTTVTIDSFLFGGGSAAALPNITVGGASGNANSAIGLTDAAFFSSIEQDFTPGTSLSFNVTTVGGAIGTPDGLAFYILQGGLPVATTDSGGLNRLLFSEILEGTAPGAPNVVFTQSDLTAQAVPEPMTLSLFGVGAAILGLRRTRTQRLQQS